MGLMLNTKKWDRLTRIWALVDLLVVIAVAVSGALTGV